jgi:hypothetical protein
MAGADRRTFLNFAAAVPAGLDKAGLDKALAIPAAARTGSIADVEHVIFLMQENRSFDHYFGTLRGLRGFADPHPARLANGKSVWHQPGGPGGADLLPFRPDRRARRLHADRPGPPPRRGADPPPADPATAGYDLSVSGPNGFFRGFTAAEPSAVAVRAGYDRGGERMGLILANTGRSVVPVTVVDAYMSRRTTLTLRGRQHHRPGNGRPHPFSKRLTCR